MPELKTLGAVIGLYEKQLQVADQTQEQLRAEVEQLQRDLGIERQRAEFEWYWGRIFGSQIRALRAMKSTEGLVQEMMELFFNEFKENLPADAREIWPFDTWVKFLLAPGLYDISLGVRDEDGLYRVTPKGDAFLTYIDARGYTNRAY